MRFYSAANNTEELCANYFKLNSTWSIETHNSSSEAAKAVSQRSSLNHAAIASPDAAREYNLITLVDDLFVNEVEPVMHFWVLANSPITLETVSPSSLITSVKLTCSGITQLEDFCEKNDLSISIFKRSNTTLNDYYIDFTGELSLEQQQILVSEFNNTKLLGVFPASRHRQEYQGQFFIRKIEQ